jgi:hypothetical protein
VSSTKPKRSSRHRSIQRAMPRSWSARLAGIRG